MIALGVVSALLAATLPIVVLLILNAREERPVWQVAFDISAAIAIDLVIILLLSRLCVSDVAAWIAKGLWLAAGAGILVYRKRTGRRMPSWPIALTRRLMLRALLLGLLGLAVSLTMSRACAIWDRQFHIPLATSLRGQVAPFTAAYEPWKTLFYHYGGDLYAANLQAYSFGILHASHALSLIHDYGFFLLGVSVALTLHSAGLQRPGLAAVVYLTMLFSGPVTMLYGAQTRPFPYNLINFICLSYRAHVPLGVLLVLPFFVLPMVRLKDLERDVSLYDLLLPLSACAAIEIITDEFSVGAVGLSLGLLWLWQPRVFGKNRLQGLILFAGLGLSMVLGAVVFKGTLAPGGPHYPLQFQAPHSPGYYQPSLPFTAPRGLFLFVMDLLPIFGVFLGGLLMLIRSRDPFFLGTFLTYATMTIVGVLLFSTLSYNGAGTENHRFVTAPMVFGPMVAAVWLLPRAENYSVVSGFPGLLVMLAIGLGTANSIEWLIGSDVYPGCIDVGIGGKYYDVNCRTETGAGVVTQRSATTYVEPSLVYRYTGCNPTFVVGPAENLESHDTKIGVARMGLDAVREIDRDPRFLDPNAPLPVVCLRERSTDRACSLLKKAGACKPAGSLTEICVMTPAQRHALLGKR